MSASLAEAARAAGLTVRDRRRAALFGLFCADSLAMPVHWYYSLDQLKRDYGKIEGYVKPKEHLEGSILNLSNTGGGGRGSDKGSIIGDVINHGKKQYWGRGLNYHYHLGLEAGDNTLEASLARLLLRTLGSADAGGVDAAPASFLSAYVTFMTTPGSHNDTYASTCHRMFFANYVKGVAPERCADNDGHNTDAIDALTLVIPVAVARSGHALADAQRSAKEVVALTRRSTVLGGFSDVYVELLTAVLHGTPLRTAVERAATAVGIPSIATVVARTRSDPMTACYIDSSFPALLFFAYKYADDLEQGLLANANAGGENVARGAALGALLGAAHGLGAFPARFLGLRDAEGILREVDAVLDTFPDGEPTGGSDACPAGGVGAGTGSVPGTA